GVYGISDDEVNVYQGNNRTDIVVKHIDSKQEKHFNLIYENVEISVKFGFFLRKAFHRHTFESDLCKLFNQNGIIAHIIQVTEEDGGLDLLLSYQ
ncbi:31905_t:CDS:2, partial [Racocetra persica]